MNVVLSLVAAFFFLGGIYLVVLQVRLRAAVRASGRITSLLKLYANSGLVRKMHIEARRYEPLFDNTVFIPWRSIKARGRMAEAAVLEIAKNAGLELPAEPGSA